MNDPAIHIQDLVKQFTPQDPPALNNLTAHIERGKITGVVGPDGAGKTTLLRMMAGLLLPTEGAIKVHGFDTIKDADDLHKIIGYMPQKFGLYEELSVLENLTLYADVRSIPLNERKEIFDQLLEFTNLAPFQSRLAGNLSGGMKQKLGLSCALLKQPEILLMDEASVGVDPISRRELWKIVADLVATGKTSVIWSTSYLDEAEACDDVLVLNEGNLLYKGKPNGLVAKVKGRVFQSESVGQNIRKTLLELIKDTRLTDALIVGSSIRFTLKAGVTDFQTALFSYSPVAPIFEDGFIDILGGIHERESKIAQKIDTVEFDRSAVISTQNLTKKFGDFTAASQVTFDVKPGEVFGFLGPNGAGKSTTFKMLCGILKPTEGESSVLGYDLRTASLLARQEIGYMAQKFSLFDNLTVKQNLTFFAGIYGLDRATSQRRIDQMLDIFNLDRYLNESAGTLPLGYKQRLALACALMHRPKILFLDEPTSGVDPITRREFWMHINGMVQRGVTIMVTTHFMDEAEYCDRICLIYKGQVIALGSPDELKKKATHKGEAVLSVEDTFIRLIEKHDEEDAHGTKPNV